MPKYSLPLSLEDVYELTEHVISLKGNDFRYQQKQRNVWCLYWHKEENACGCIIGHILFAAGVSPDILREADEYLLGGALDTNAVLRPYFQPEALAFSCTLQRLQDKGAVWRNAFIQAKKSIPVLSQDGV